MNKFKNFIEDIILSIKNRFQSSKYVVKGKCKQCGLCCTCILFLDENGYIKDEAAFKKLQKKHLIYRYFFPNGKVENEAGNLTGAILFKCRHLKNKKCSIYWFRPVFCRDYPSINREFVERGGTTLDNCGFYFEPDKKFNEYLKDTNNQKP